MSAAPDRAEELFTEHSRRIYAYCLRQLGSREEAEDAVQATYLNACRSLLSGFEPEIAQAWLFKVAQNVCLTKQRSTWRRRRIERPGDIQAMEDLIPSPHEPGDELLGIDEALASLPEQQQRAILLREWQGLSYREVAAEMGITQGAVETLIFRARRSLAAALEEPSGPVRTCVRGRSAARVAQGDAQRQPQHEPRHRPRRGGVGDRDCDRAGRSCRLVEAAPLHAPNGDAVSGSTDRAHGARRPRSDLGRARQ
jgi:RNA polymerase sigma-70 factor (ECF subfamily)